MVCKRGSRMNDQHWPLRHLGDLGATSLWAVSLASQWAQLLTPIATLVLTLLGILWWIIRFRDWWRTGRTGRCASCR